MGLSVLKLGKFWVNHVVFIKVTYSSSVTVTHIKRSHMDNLKNIYFCFEFFTHTSKPTEN